MTLRTSIVRSELRVGRKIGSGGQGDVYVVLPESRNLVFKRYHESELKRRPELHLKVRAMVKNPPTSNVTSAGHPLMTWPLDLVYDGARFVGFTMPHVQARDAVPLHSVANPSDRDESASWTRLLDWKALVVISRNLIESVALLHGNGVVIGDFQESNVLVRKNGEITLLDCDSMQVLDPRDGQRYLCPVGRPEFTPPELINAKFERTVRAPSSDLFSLAVHLHQMLLQGEHPFRGKWHGTGEKPRAHILAREGLWAHAGDPRLSPRSEAITAGILPNYILALFRRAFVEGARNPRDRPGAAEWCSALDKMIHELHRCKINRDHVYIKTLPRCPWCKHQQDQKAAHSTQVVTGRSTSASADTKKPALPRTGGANPPAPAPTTQRSAGVVQTPPILVPKPAPAPAPAPAGPVTAPGLPQGGVPRPQGGGTRRSLPTTPGGPSVNPRPPVSNTGGVRRRRPAAVALKAVAALAATAIAIFLAAVIYSATDATADVDQSISSHTIANLRCSDDYILVLKSSVDPGATQDDLEPVLKAHEGSQYLRTDQSCSSFTQISDKGNPIYAAYVGPFTSRSKAMRECAGMPADSYVKQLSEGKKKIWKCQS